MKKQAMPKSLKGCVSQFQIFKKGTTTNGKVTIVSPDGEKFDRVAKINFYLSLGYKVFNMNGKEIKPLYYMLTRQYGYPLYIFIDNGNISVTDIEKEAEKFTIEDVLSCAKLNYYRAFTTYDLQFELINI